PCARTRSSMPPISRGAARVRTNVKGERNQSFAVVFYCCDCWPWQNAVLWLSCGQNLSPASPAGLFLISFATCRGNRTRIMRFSCGRFHCVLDFGPRTNGRPTGFAGDDHVVGRLVGNVQPASTLLA